MLPTKLGSRSSQSICGKKSYGLLSSIFNVTYDIQNVRLHETTLCGLTKLDMDMQIFRKQQCEVMIYTGGLTW
jgi:hypothetical protein